MISRPMNKIPALIAAFAVAAFCPLTFAADEEPPANPEETTKASTEEKEPVDMFEILDYDENLDIFNEPGTKTPYTGPVFSTSEEGIRESEGYLKDGREEGWWIEYHENGNKASEGLYKAGSEEGYWKYYHDNGAFESGGVYKDGVPVGKWVSFFESGKIDFEGNYVDGLMDGDWTFYDEKTGEARVIKFDKGTQLTE